MNVDAALIITEEQLVREDYSKQLHQLPFMLDAVASLKPLCCYGTISG